MLGLLTIQATAMPAAVAVFVVGSTAIGAFLRPSWAKPVALGYAVLVAVLVAITPPPPLPSGPPSPLWAPIPALATVGIGALIRKTIVARQHADHLAVLLDRANAELEQCARTSDRLAATRQRVEIANELYHRLANALAASELHAEVAERKSSLGDADGARSSVTTALAAIEDGMLELRRCVTLLRERGEASLSEVVTAMAERLSTDQLRTEVSVIGEERRVDAGREFALFRVIQESLAAGARQADGGVLDVTLDYTGPRVRLHVTDHGSGALTRPGPGLLEVHERISAHGGSLRVEDDAAGEVVLTAEVPLAS